MFKQSPSGRMNRSRGFKVKNVLQICVLLAVCLWLVYQVKQSHEKKKQFDGNESSLSQKTGSSSDGGPNLGRKYLPDSKGMANSGTEDNNLEEDGRGGGDDDLEEHDREKNDGEVEREDKAVGDDEKESEERDSDDNNGDEISEDNENDEDSGSKHEAQEVLYKADDASSAVTHDSIEEVSENAEVNVLEQAGVVNNDNKISDGQDTIGHEESEHVSEGLNGHPVERNLTEKTGEANDLSIQKRDDSALVVNNSLSESNLTTLKNGDAESTESDSSAESNHSKSSVSEKVIHGHPRFTTEDDRWSTTIDTDAEKSRTVDETGRADEEFESFNTENIGEIEDLIDSSDSSFSLDEKDVRTDLETLPEIQTEGSNTEDPAAK
ncbi:PREDICTED: protein PFC0760c-like [Ipomoea nil]|uniref:protein PFC0760c-like n=1 Tax=Ipomoea nil TaxID=35883 RepID=UPI000900E9AB|nr:PREDICTED: protein PFC0760c-like [Ipomoea nil]XP_019172877.1 PREDICTED: protein PFC0760c-like [Ipomoea nil]